ncbi:Photosystem I assembly protein Ycf3, partial [Mucuna pruriens]
MPRSRINENFIDKTFSIVANILLQIIPTTSGEKKAFTYYRDAKGYTYTYGVRQHGERSTTLRNQQHENFVKKKDILPCLIGIGTNKNGWDNKHPSRLYFGYPYNHRRLLNVEDKEIVEVTVFLSSTNILNNYYEAMRLEIDPYDRSYILYNIGLIHTSNGEHTKALEYYFRALERNPFLPQAFNNMAVICHYGDSEVAESWFNQAAEYWKQAIALTPGNYIEAQNWLKITGRFE